MPEDYPLTPTSNTPPTATPTSIAQAVQSQQAASADGLPITHVPHAFTPMPQHPHHNMSNFYSGRPIHPMAPANIGSWPGRPPAPQNFFAPQNPGPGQFNRPPINAQTPGGGFGFVMSTPMSYAKSISKEQTATISKSKPGSNTTPNKKKDSTPGSSQPTGVTRLSQGYSTTPTMGQSAPGSILYFEQQDTGGVDRACFANAVNNALGYQAVSAAGVIQYLQTGGQAGRADLAEGQNVEEGLQYLADSLHLPHIEHFALTNQRGLSQHRTIIQGKMNDALPPQVGDVVDFAHRGPLLIMRPGDVAKNRSNHWTAIYRLHDNSYAHLDGRKTIKRFQDDQTLKNELTRWATESQEQGAYLDIIGFLRPSEAGTHSGTSTSQPNPAIMPETAAASGTGSPKVINDEFLDHFRKLAPDVKHHVWGYAPAMYIKEYLQACAGMPPRQLLSDARYLYEQQVGGYNGQERSGFVVEILRSLPDAIGGIRVRPFVLHLYQGPRQWRSTAESMIKCLCDPKQHANRMARLPHLHDYLRQVACSGSVIGHEKAAADHEELMASYIDRLPNMISVDDVTPITGAVQYDHTGMPMKGGGICPRLPRRRSLFSPMNCNNFTPQGRTLHWNACVCGCKSLAAIC